VEGLFGGAFQWEHRWFDAGILVLFIVAMRLGFFLGLKYVRYEKR
jgi:hypothetical protein